jgi:hypothetical protein
VTVPAAQSFVRGFVHEQGKQEGVPNAIVAFQGGAQPPLATGADGRFLSRHVEPGQYTFEVTAAGFKPGTCTATVKRSGPEPDQHPGAAAPACGQHRAALRAGVHPISTARSRRCPRTGNVEGQVKDATSGNAISGAVITITDALGKDHKVTADGTGKFKAEALPPGDVSMRSEASGYMNNVSSSEVRPNESARPTISMNKRPKTALVKVQGNEIKLSDKIHFEVDSAKILGQSSALLEEVAEVMQFERPRSRRSRSRATRTTRARSEHNAEAPPTAARELRA